MARKTADSFDKLLGEVLGTHKLLDHFRDAWAREAAEVAQLENELAAKGGKDFLRTSVSNPDGLSSKEFFA